MSTVASLDEPSAAVDARTRAVTYEMDGASLGRPTMLPSEAPAKQITAPRAWDPKVLFANDRIRKQALYKPGTFNDAPAAAGLRPPKPSKAAAGGSPASGVRFMDGAGPRTSVMARPTMARQSSAMFGAGGARPSRMKMSFAGPRAHFLRDYIWLLMPHATRKPTWHKCFADLRGHHLIYRQVRGQNDQVVREGAILLSGCDVFKLDSLFASDLARWLGSLPGVKGLELRPLGSQTPVIFCFSGSDALERWELQLTREAHHPGVGNLLLRKGGKGKDESFWCVVHVNPNVDPNREEKELRCYSKALDIVRGRNPARKFDLRNAELLPLDDICKNAGCCRQSWNGRADESCCRTCAKSNGSEHGRECEKKWLTQDDCVARGFSLHEAAEMGKGTLHADGRSLNCMAGFVVEPPGDTEAWTDVLQTLCAASALHVSTADDYSAGSFSLGSGRPLSFGFGPPALSYDDEEDPFDMFNEGRPSCAPRGDRPEGEHSLKITNLLEEDEDEDEEEEVEPDDPIITLDEMDLRSELEDDDDASVIDELDNTMSEISGADDLDDPPSDASASASDEEEVEGEAAPLMNLRYLKRELRLQTKDLNEALRSQDFTAKLTLSKCFGEKAPPQGALAKLHVLLDKVAGFSTDFDNAVKKVNEVRAGRPKGKAKGKAKPKPKQSMAAAAAAASAAVVHQPILRATPKKKPIVQEPAALASPVTPASPDVADEKNTRRASRLAQFDVSPSPAEAETASPVPATHEASSSAAPEREASQAHQEQLAKTQKKLKELAELKAQLTGDGAANLSEEEQGRLLRRVVELSGAGAEDAEGDELF